MLWDTLAYKSWLETRWRLLFVLCMMGGFMIMFRIAGAKPMPPGGRSAAFGYIVFSLPGIVVTTSGFLAGAGIATQPGLQATKGLHGSTMFTLSLPASRFQLLAVRSGLGWLEMASAIGVQCFGMRFGLPFLKGTGTSAEMLEFAGTLLACASAIYFLSVLLATFLDEPWRVWGTLIGCGLLWWLPSHAHLPVFVDIFRAMGEASPLIAHTMPWAAMTFSLALAAALFFAALKVVQAREY
jgi:hypothetical protein